MLSAKVEDSIKQGQELAIYGYKQLDQDKDGKVSIDDLKICSSTAYSFVMNIDFKKAKLQFFEKAIGYMKQELTHDQDALKKANEQKELKVNSHFEWNNVFKLTVIYKTLMFYELFILINLNLVLTSR